MKAASCPACNRYRLTHDVRCYYCRFDFRDPKWERCKECLREAYNNLGVYYLRGWEATSPMASMGLYLLRTACSQHSLCDTLGDYCGKLITASNMLAECELLPSLRARLVSVVRALRRRCESSKEFAEGLLVEEAVEWCRCLGELLLRLSGDKEWNDLLKTTRQQGRSASKATGDQLLLSGGDASAEAAESASTSG